jgi:diguanylate cyclase (GGDEF)-like protein
MPEYPALQRIALLAVVKRGQTRSFALRVSAGRSTTLHVTPAGARSEYCLTSAEVARRGVPAPAGLDYCAREKRLLGSRGNGKVIVKVFGGPAGTVETQTPVYRSLAIPASVKARNVEFVGWVRQVVSPAVLAQQALIGRPGYTVALRYGPSQADIASAGAALSGAQSAVSTLSGRWTLTSYGPPATAPLLAGGRIWVLLAGTLIGLLLVLLALLLGRSPGQELAPAPALPAPEPPAEAVEPLYDELTGLPNRALTLDRASLVLARASRQSGLLAGVLLIDIDWFKDVNDKLGREAGDQLLKIVAQRLQGVMRTEDTVGRLGDDQFAVLVECTARSLRLDALAQRVLEALHRPLEIEGFGPTFSMTASVGVAFGRYESAEDLLRDAGATLQSAKADGKGRYKLFDSSARSVVEGRGGLEADLSAAVQEGALKLLYAPIYDLQTHTVTGFEAKPCWEHPERGLINAEELLQLAEDGGLIVPVDRFTLEQACGRAAAWEVQGRRVGVSVKVGAEQLHREGLITDVRRALQQSGVQPDLLTLEVAESAVMSDVAEAAQRLAEIKRLGVHLAIDDFGDSGYAYHSDLRKLPIDCLRVQRSALAASDDPEYRNWLFEAILMVGRELSLAVVAKDVQSEEQLDELQAMGCTVAQGPFLGEAVAAEAVAEFSVAPIPAHA